jgi:hypothetical protein
VVPANPHGDARDRGSLVSVESTKTVVTAIDLAPAPQLAINSITPLGGRCNGGIGTKSN